MSPSSLLKRYRGDQRPRWGPDRIGINWGSNERDAETADVLRTMVQCGFKWHRITISWEVIETADNTYSWTTYDNVVGINAATGGTQDPPTGLQKAGANILASVGFTPAWARVAGTIFDPPTVMTTFSDFMTVLVNRYKTQIKYWEIWNEPDLPSQFYSLGTAAQAAASYAEMLSRCYDAIKAEDPTAKVVMGGLALDGTGIRSTFLTDVLDNALFPCVGKFDIMNWHQYGTKGEGSVDNTAIRAALLARDIDVPIWLTEVGYGSAATNPPQDQTGYQAGAPSQAQWMREMLPFYLDQLQQDKVFWFMARDDTASFGANYETHGLVTETTHVPKISFEEMQRLLRD